ncbi:MAG: hypothetical protein ACI9T8_000545 [Candidatus Saccharimonadales bacterium]|jgi:hypothetical protein
MNAIKWLYRLGRFLGILVAFFVLYRLLLSELFDDTAYILPAFAIWAVSSYVAIPWFHRRMTKYYLPNYFVGRIRSSDGLLSDPVNLAFFGSEEQVHESFIDAGWSLAEPLTVSSFIKAALAVLRRQSYPTAPVGSFYLFNRKQDFAYQQEVNGSPKARHHVRIWKTPRGWRLPGGHKSEWLAAATYDTTLGIKLQNGQIDHMIHENIDEERDYIIKTLKKANKIKKLEVIKHFTAAYHDRNNGGDRIKTDGALPFVTLK